MKQKKESTLKKVVRVIDNVVSTALPLLAIALCAYILIVNVVSNRTGESPFYFGYRPCMIQSGSMEPYLQTNGIVMTKKVTSMEELQVGDVITYTAETEDGDTIFITHRIIDMTKDGYITTKGDNNNVDDGFLLTMDNVEAKVVGVYNQPSVWLVDTWQKDIIGKATIILICLAVICVFMALGTLLNGWLDSDKIEEKAVARYAKLCMLLGLSPVETFQNDLNRLEDLWTAQQEQAVLAESEVGEGTSPDEVQEPPADEDPSIVGKNFVPSDKSSVGTEPEPVQPDAQNN